MSFQPWTIATDDCNTVDLGECSCMQQDQLYRSDNGLEFHTHSSWVINNHHWHQFRVVQHIIRICFLFCEYEYVLLQYFMALSLIFKLFVLSCSVPHTYKDDNGCRVLAQYWNKLENVGYISALDPKWSQNRVCGEKTQSFPWGCIKKYYQHALIHV